MHVILGDAVVCTRSLETLVFIEASVVLGDIYVSFFFKMYPQLHPIYIMYSFTRPHHHLNWCHSDWLDWFCQKAGGDHCLRFKLRRMPCFLLEVQKTKKPATKACEWDVAILDGKRKVDRASGVPTFSTSTLINAKQTLSKCKMAISVSEQTRSALSVEILLAVNQRIWIRVQHSTNLPNFLPCPTHLLSKNLAWRLSTRIMLLLQIRALRPRRQTIINLHPFPIENSQHPPKNRDLSLHPLMSDIGSYG